MKFNTALIYNHMNKHNITFKEFCDCIGTSTVALTHLMASNFHTAQRCGINLYTIIKLADVLNVSTDDLVVK